MSSDIGKRMYEVFRGLISNPRIEAALAELEAATEDLKRTARAEKRDEVPSKNGYAHGHAEPYRKRRN